MLGPRLGSSRHCRLQASRIPLRCPACTSEAGGQVQALRVACLLPAPKFEPGERSVCVCTRRPPLQRCVVWLLAVAGPVEREVLVVTPSSPPHLRPSTPQDHIKVRICVGSSEHTHSQCTRHPHSSIRIRTPPSNTLQRQHEQPTEQTQQMQHRQYTHTHAKAPPPTACIEPDRTGRDRLTLLPIVTA